MGRGQPGVVRGQTFADGQGVAKERGQERHLQRDLDRPAYDRCVALVPERRRLFGGLTVLENLRTGAYGRKRSEVEATLAEIFDLFPNLKRLRNALAFSAAMDVVAEAATSGERVALVFGREDWGLSNQMLDACHAVTTIPTNPAYPSLNLAPSGLSQVDYIQFRVPDDNNASTHNELVVDAVSINNNAVGAPVPEPGMAVAMASFVLALLDRRRTSH